MRSANDTRNVELFTRRLAELQDDIRSLRIEVDRFSGRAKNLVFEGTQH
jgi:hypothetical protein